MFLRRQRENPEGRIRMRRLVAVLVCVAAVVTCAEIVELKTAAANCCVELEGARITSFKVEGKELLWNAEPIQLTAKDWAHGGIPVCWPWFGVDEKGEIHGYAWRRRFCIRNRREGPDRMSKSTAVPPVAYSGDDWLGAASKVSTLTFVSPDGTETILDKTGTGAQSFTFDKPGHWTVRLVAGGTTRTADILNRDTFTVIIR